MTKTIFNQELKRYYYNYYCDSCFKVVINGEIYRNDNAIENNFFDLCLECKGKWDNDTSR